ncbi:MAG: hypothetical protein ACLU84_01805 [Clostridia bacterium]
MLTKQQEMIISKDNLISRLINSLVERLNEIKILTHAPTEILEENQINIFGHIHDKPLDERFNENSHVYLSCDVVDYTPISIKEINDKMKI